MSITQNKHKWYEKDYFAQHKTLRKRFWRARLSLIQGGSTSNATRESIEAIPTNIELYLKSYYKRYFTWPWSWKSRRKRQENRFKLIDNLQTYEKEVRYTLACSKNSNFSTLAQTSLLQHHAPWGLNALSGEKPQHIHGKPGKIEHILYRYGLPLWRFSAYSLLVLSLVITITTFCFLAVTGGLGAPIAQFFAQTAQLFGLGSVLNGFLALAPVVWFTAHGGLTMAMAALSTLFTVLIHREIANPGFYARALNQYGHVVGYNVADWLTLLASLPLLHSILTLSATWGKKGLRAYGRGKIPLKEESTLTGTLHNIANITPAPDDTGHLMKWLFNPIRWIQSTLTLFFLLACFISEGLSKAGKKSHPVSGFFKLCAASIYFPVYLVLEPLKALCDIPYHIIDACLVTPLENGIQQLIWRIRDKGEEESVEGEVNRAKDKDSEKSIPVTMEYFLGDSNGSSTPSTGFTAYENNPLLLNSQYSVNETYQATAFTQAGYEAHTPSAWTPTAKK